MKLFELIELFGKLCFTFEFVNVSTLYVVVTESTQRGVEIIEEGHGVQASDRVKEWITEHLSYGRPVLRFHLNHSFNKGFCVCWQHCLRVLLKLQEASLCAELEDQVVTCATEWRLSNKKLVQNTAETPNVRSLGSRLVVYAFGSHVLASTDKVDVLLSLGVVVDFSCTDFWLTEVVSRAKVDQFNAGAGISVKEHVFWF